MKLLKGAWYVWTDIGEHLNTQMLPHIQPCCHSGGCQQECAEQDTLRYVRMHAAAVCCAVASPEDVGERVGV